MEINTMENFLMVKEMAQDVLYTKTEINMKANGKIIKDMGMAR